MELIETVNKLIGNCNPQGCSTIDKVALISVTRKINLIQELIFDLQDIAKNVISHEYSVKYVEDKRDEFLKELKESL